MKKIIRTNNLQKALEDYDALKGQAVSYVSVLPVSPDIRNSVYCKQTTTDVEDSLNITVESLIQDYAEETETADHYVIPVTYTVEYLGIAVRAIEVSGDVAIMYEDEDFTTALAASFNLEDKYTFAVTTHVTEMAYYMGDAVNQVLHPVVSFGVIAEVNKRIDVVERELDDKADVSALVQLDNKIDNSYNTLDNKIDNNYNTLDNKIDNNYNTLDNKIDNSYNTLDNKIDNEIANLAVNFTTNNLVVNVATINNATVNNVTIDTAQVNNFDVSTIIINGSTGSDGQVLGKVNGNVEWFSPSLDTNDFKVNYLTVNNSSFTDNATINNLVVNNATLPRTVTKDVSYNVSGGPYIYEEILKRQTGFGEPGITSTDYNFQFLPFIIMPEDEYNKSVFDKGNETYSSSYGTAYRNVMSDPVLAFVATAPFGNIYFAGKKIADANCNLEVERLVLDWFIFPTPASTASLVFTNTSVTNNFSKDVNVKITSVLGSGVFNNSRANLPYGIDRNNANGVITTNVKNTSFTSFANFFQDSYSITDCFLTNPSLIVNAPSGYNVWNNVTNLDKAFKSCYNFNKPITIPNGITSMAETFAECYNFNQPIIIPDSVTSMYQILAVYPGHTGNFNSPVTIGKGITNMTGAFYGCPKLASSSVPIHISHEIALGNTSNYIYNCLVNGNCSITFAPSRILNDA